MTKRKTKTGMDRRGFLRSAAGAGSGIALASQAMASRAAESRDAINVAMIGVGTQGQALVNCCAKIPGIRIKAICDIWTAFNMARTSVVLQAYRQEHTTYADYRDLLEKEKSLDAVIIATPDFCHAEQAVACLKAGLHVYCETPMSNTLDGARAMVKAARETGKLLQIGQQRRSSPRYRHCAEKLLGEVRLLGRIAAINGQWNRSVQPDRGWPRRAPVDEAALKQYGYQSMQQFRNWRWYAGLGSGPVVELGSHQVDVFNWFLNTPPNAVIASGGIDYYDAKTHQWYDTAMAVFEYQTSKGPTRAYYQVLNANSNFGSYEKLLGEDGTLVLSEEAGMANVYREPAAPDWDRWVHLGFLSRPDQKAEKEKDTALFGVTDTLGPPQYTVPVKFDDPYHKPHLENFFDAVRGKADLHCPPEVAYQTAVTVGKIHDAIKAGRRIAFKPDEFTV